MNARPKHYVDLYEAAAIVYSTPPAERDPSIDEARAIEAREDQRRDDDYVETESED